MKIILLTILLCLPLWGREYPATVTKVLDGDTIEVIIDLGLGVTKKETIRFLGVSAPEIRLNSKLPKEESAKQKARGLEVKRLLEEKIINKEVTLQTVKDRRGKYGRLLGIIFLKGEDINKWVTNLEAYEESSK